MSLKEIKKSMRDLYDRSLALGMLDESGNAAVKLDTLDYKFKVGRHGWLYLTGLPKKLTSAKKIVVPGVFDILDCKMPKGIEELDLGNILYWIDEYPIQYKKLRKLVGKKLLLSKYMTENFDITQYWYTAGHKKSKIMTYMINDIFLNVAPECEIDFPKLAYMDRTYSYYFYKGKFKAADKYLHIANSLVPGNIGYKQLIEDREKDLEADRKSIIAKWKRGRKAGKPFSVWMGWLYGYSEGKLVCYANTGIEFNLASSSNPLDNQPDWAF